MYIYAQGGIGISFDKFVSVGEFVSLSWLEWIVQSDIHSCRYRIDVSAVVGLRVQ